MFSSEGAMLAVNAKVTVLSRMQHMMAVLKVEEWVIRFRNEEKSMLLLLDHRAPHF